MRLRTTLQEGRRRKEGKVREREGEKRGKEGGRSRCDEHEMESELDKAKFAKKRREGGGQNVCADILSFCVDWFLTSKMMSWVWL